MATQVRGPGIGPVAVGIRACDTRLRPACPGSDSLASRDGRRGGGGGEVVAWVCHRLKSRLRRIAVAWVCHGLMSSLRHMAIAQG